MTTTITASQFRKTIGKYLQLAQSEPVIIERANKEPMVLISAAALKYVAGIEGIDKLDGYYEYFRVEVNDRNRR